ncbi:MAG: AAA family ATPase [Polyangiales bacterium]
MHGFAGYDITESLYESERSRVFRATRTSDGRRVVLKLSRGTGEAAEAAARSEFELGAGADDEAAPLYLAVERDELRVAIVMHDFGDDSLDRSIPREGMDPGDFLPLATRIADRLAALHRAGVLHLDVKPANVLVAPGFSAVRFCDFDLSRRLDAAAEPLAQSALAGTLAYISPEQTGRMDRPVDHRSDLYSLGVTLYEMLAGQRPFAGDAVELVYAHLALAPPPLRADVPAPVAAIVRKLLAKDPDARYRSARGVALDLARARDAFAATGAVDDFEPGLRDVSPRLLVPETFHGRGREVDALLAAFEAAAGGASRMVLVRGWPGVGKSALVQRLRQPVVARRGLFASGKFDLLHRDVPYAALVGAVRGLIRGILSEPESVVAAWRTRIAGALGQSGQVMIDVIPELALVVGAQPKAVEVGAVEARGRFHWLSLAFIAALASPASPLVLFLDDLQWADDASLRLIEALLTEVDARHLLIVGAYRDNKGEALHGLTLTRAAIEKVKPIEELALAPLGADEVDAMIADTLGRPVDEVRDLGALVTRKTRGNPFFVRQLLTAVHREGLLAFDEVRARWTCDVARIEAMGFDDDVVEFMVQEIRKLGDGAQRALSLGACIGSRFAPRTLAIVAGLDVDEALAQLAEARTRGLLVLDAPVGAAAREEVTLRFLHDRVQHAAYSLTPEGDRARLHLTMGRLLVRDLDAGQRARLFEVVRHLNEGRR